MRKRLRAAASVAFVLGMGAVPASAQRPPPLASATPSPAVLEVDRLLARADESEQNIRQEIRDLKGQIEVTQKRIIFRGRAYYRLVRVGLLPVGGGFDALVDHAAHVERARRALERDIASEAGMVRRIGELDSRLSQLHAERAPLEVQRDALNHARLALKQIEERRAAFARAFETSVRPDSVAVYGADFGPAPDPQGGFRSLKGRLPFPIAGRAEVNRTHRGGDPGVELLAPFGTPVRSVAAGRVAFADTQDDYGLTIILDHGDRYFSLYGNLGTVDMRVGETVTAGARVGTVGSGSGGAPRLYFEIRRNATTLDPGPWLGL